MEAQFNKISAHQILRYKFKRVMQCEVSRDSLVMLEELIIKC